MKEHILEIIQKNYNTFKGTNEAELHSSEEIEEMFILFNDFKDKNYTTVKSSEGEAYVNFRENKVLLRGSDLYYRNLIKLHGKNIQQIFKEFKKINPQK